MNFHEELIISDKIKWTKNELIDKLSSGDPFFHTYFIVVPLSDIGNQIEFFHMEICRQELFSLEEYLIIGVAFGKADASALVVKIIDDIYQETGSADIRSYFISKYERTEILC